MILFNFKTIKPSSTIMEKIVQLIRSGNTAKSLVEIINTEERRLGYFTSSGHTLLHYAILYARYDVAEVLLQKGVDPNKPSRMNESPLKTACSQQDLKMSKLLFKYGAKIMPHDSLLLQAVKDNILPLIILLIANKADLTVVSSDGNNLIHIACTRNAVSTAHVLMKTKKFNVEAPNSNGETPLMLASRYSHFEMIEYLICECRAKVTPDLIDFLFTTENILTVNNIIKYLFCVGVCQNNVDDPTVLNFFLKWTRELDLMCIESQTGWQVIHQAACFGCLKITKKLMRTGYYDVNVLTNNDQSMTPLFLALSDAKNVDVSMYLLRKGADPSIVSSSLTETLSAFEIGCVEPGNLRVVKMMLKMYPNLDINAGMDVAVRFSNQKTAGYLLRKGARAPESEEFSELLKTRLRVCNVCMAEGYTWKKCGQCLQTFYCSKECQHKGWKEGHKLTCQK